MMLTIGVPIFNESKYLFKTLKSLQVQSFDNFVVILSDNNSDDNSKEICKKFAKEDARFRYISHEKNIGSLNNFE